MNTYSTTEPRRTTHDASATAADLAAERRIGKAASGLPRPDRKLPGRAPLKVVIQIPCHNEEQTLPETIAALPRSIEGVDAIEYLVINDGSSDGTVKTALDLGVHHVLDIRTNRGLADAFCRGMQASLAVGADIVVNTDGDNQYEGADIAKLVKPIVERRADMVIGDRGVTRVEHFSTIKRALQALGSRVVSFMARTHIPDATSGFRAYSRDAAINMVITGTYTYTLESILLAAHSGLKIVSTPIRCRSVKRKSRLFRSIPEYIWRAGLSMFRAFLFYNPALVFVVFGLTALFLGAAALTASWLLPALPSFVFVLGNMACAGGVTAMLLSIMADIINSQRRYNREILLTLRRNSLLGGSELRSTAYIRNTNA